MLFPLLINWFGWKTGFRESKEEGKDQKYSQVPKLTQDTTRESEKNTRKHHTQESQKANPFGNSDK